MRGGAIAQFLLGLGQSDVERALARGDARHQELRRDRRLAGAGAAFEQEQAAAAQPAGQDLVEARHPGCTIAHSASLRHATVASHDAPRRRTARSYQTIRDEETAFALACSPPNG